MHPGTLECDVSSCRWPGILQVAWRWAAGVMLQKALCPGFQSMTWGPSPRQSSPDVSSLQGGYLGCILTLIFFTQQTGRKCPMSRE